MRFAHDMHATRAHALACALAREKTCKINMYFSCFFGPEARDDRGNGLFGRVRRSPGKFDQILIIFSPVFTGVCIGWGAGRRREAPGRELFIMFFFIFKKEQYLIYLNIVLFSF